LPALAADHNLLAAALALQLGFVPREPLLAAARAIGMCENGPTLVEALRSRNAITNEDAELLAAAVARQLARHGNDAQRCLALFQYNDELSDLAAALSLAPWPTAGPARPAADTIHFAAREADPHATRNDAVAGDAGQSSGRPSDVMLASSSAPTAMYSKSKPGGEPATASPTASFGEPLSTPAVRRFSILRPFQRGGLGQVSVARDAELNREVALKEILPKHADSDEARQRFLMEAEVTGSLEHPGVVPVYGLGQYADGRPFYAMRFIHGDNMLIAIDELHRVPPLPDRELRFHQLLARFVAVCNAMEYAHNRCVLHRDIKPGNIMLGHYGETLIVDWGLAKALGAPEQPRDVFEQPVQPASAGNSTETQQGRIVGTPAYMSPEQAKGLVNVLGPAADIYSLGATLYHILTGRAAFSDIDRDALVGSVQMGRFTHPRTVKRDVPRALEAICLKAMSKEPEDRYASARAMGEDVDRFLADEPVRALNEGVLAKLARWTRKHRAAVGGVVATLTAIAGLLSIGLVLLNAANQRAEHNFEMARKAIREYYTTVSEDELLDAPGMQPLRERLLRQALEYYKQFLASGQRNDLLDEVAEANFYIGSITERLDSPAEALPYYEQAVAASEQLVKLSPNDEGRLETHARALSALGESLQKLERVKESQNYLKQEEEIRNRLEFQSDKILPASPNGK
jgi:tRNA A-37 threonylcarbamoyl transferase component Bud32